MEKKRGEYNVDKRKNQQISLATTDRNKPPGSWRPKGILLAHLHEHEGGIQKICRLPEKPIFASAASDGCIRVRNSNYITP